MVDHLTPQKRSELMSRIRGRNNLSTEIRLLRLLKKEAITGWRRHLRFPGRPDFAFPKQRMLIFVDGDFWHGNPRTFKGPKSNTAFWIQKVERNRIRDREVSRHLRKQGWTVMRIWESDLRRYPDRCMARIKRLLAAGLG
jgi:DNA mismatch endonuclease (patch repair protein)